MYRDTLILLVLKEIFHDPYLANMIYNFVIKYEIYTNSVLYKIKCNELREDIHMLYPGFIKTALFENIRFDLDNNIDPGYSFYSIKPLTDCGYLLDYNITPPFKYSICDYSDYKKNYNTVTLINDIRCNRSNVKEDKIKIILHRRDIYFKLDAENKHGFSIWYDFENKIFTNV